MAERGAYGSGQPKAKCMQHIAIDSGFSQPLVLECDDEQRMEPLQFLALPEPSDEFGHQPGCVERRGGLEDDGNLLAGIVKGCDTVRQRLVFAAMPVVLFAVAQKIAVELLDVVFRDRNLRPRMKDGFHDLGVSRNFLLVPCGEFLDFETSEHLLNLSVGQLASLDARRGADTLNGGDPPKGV